MCCPKGWDPGSVCVTLQRSVAIGQTGSDLECGRPLGAIGIDAGTLEHYFLCSRLCRFVIGLCIR